MFYLQFNDEAAISLEVPYLTSPVYKLSGQAGVRFCLNMFGVTAKIGHLVPALSKSMEVTHAVSGGVTLSYVELLCFMDKHDEVKAAVSE